MTWENQNISQLENDLQNWRHSKWMPQTPSKRATGYLTHHCIRPSRFPLSHNEAKVITLPKTGNTPKIPQHLRPISIPSRIDKLFENAFQSTVVRYIAEENVLNICLFSFRVHQNTTLQLMRLTDHVSLKFSNNIYTAVVCLDIDKAFDTTRHSGLLTKLLKSLFSLSIINLLSSLLSHGKLRIPLEGEISTQRNL